MHREGWSELELLNDLHFTHNVVCKGIGKLKHLSELLEVHRVIGEKVGP